MTLSDLQPLSGLSSTPAPSGPWQPLQACVAAITGRFYVVPASPLIGAMLIDHAKRYPMDFASKSDLVAASGHLKEGGKLNFISFYEALIAARIEVDPNFGNNIDDDKEYNDLSKEQKLLYDHISEDFGSKWNHDETIEFMGELKDLGIETKEKLEMVFYMIVDGGYGWERDFAEEYINTMEPNLEDSTASFAIDWQRVWDHSLTHDFYTVEFDGSVFIFFANW